MIPTIANLQAAKVKNPEKWIDAVVATCQEFEIDTPQRIAGFLAQTSHESGGYTMLSENLNYRAATLAACWPNRFAVLGADKKPVKDKQGKLTPTAVANAIAGKPELIANLCYSGRMGNGPAESGDGWKHRGMGVKQLTGKDNHKRCGDYLGVDLVANPELLLTPEFAVRSAGWFWKTNNLSAFADTSDIKDMTKKINGGYIGLEQRQALYDVCLKSVLSN
jgi:putative chitinase